MHRHGENFFCFVLTDNIFIQLGLDLGGCWNVQIADQLFDFRRLARSFFSFSSSSRRALFALTADIGSTK